MTVPNPKQPIQLVIANNRKHLTKAEIREREAGEIPPIADEISPPGYLTAKQKKRFSVLARQLGKLGIMGETDCELLGRYVVSEEAYESDTKLLRKLYKTPPKKWDYPDYQTFLGALDSWNGLVELTSKRQDRYFKQAQTAARELGLTISSRCKLVVPKAQEEPPENKFAKFRSAK